MESPLAIQTLVQRAVLGQYPCRLVILGEGEEVGMGALLVQRITLRALPLIALRSLLACVAIARHRALCSTLAYEGKESQRECTHT